MAEAKSFFQLRTLPGYDWPPLADASIAQVWVAYLELERKQWLSQAKLEQKQLEQVRTLLAHCITSVPYYREVLPKAGITPGAVQTMADFRRIPLLSRRTAQENASKLEAVTLPAGTVPTVIRQTSGSSGTPTRILQTNIVHLWWHAFYLRDLEWCGIDPKGTLAAIRSTGQKGDALERLLQGMSQPCWIAELKGLLVSGTSHLMDIQQDHRLQLQWLQRITPDYLISYPSNLEVLARLVQQEGPIKSLRVIQAISESLDEEEQKMIEAAFGVPVKNTYSCAEAGYLASPCPAGHGLHVHAENVIVEVLDEEGRPCQPGETGRVFITSLHNFRGPFLRYELGDEATLGPASCPCGRGLPLLADVRGKKTPLFHLPDGRRKNSISLGRLVRKVGGHWQHQIVQKTRNRIVVRLATDASWSDKHARELMEKVDAFFESPMELDLEIHDKLPMPEHGKFQSLICEIPE